MNTKESFSTRLAQLRTDEEISAREMSLDLGQNPSYINRIENQKAYPSMQVFFIFVIISKSLLEIFLTSI